MAPASAIATRLTHNPFTYMLLPKASEDTDSPTAGGTETATSGFTTRTVRRKEVGHENNLSDRKYLPGVALETETPSSPLDCDTHEQSCGVSIFKRRPSRNGPDFGRQSPPSRLRGPSTAELSAVKRDTPGSLTPIDIGGGCVLQGSPSEVEPPTNPTASRDVAPSPEYGQINATGKAGSSPSLSSQDDKEDDDLYDPERGHSSSISSFSPTDVPLYWGDTFCTIGHQDLEWHIGELLNQQKGPKLCRWRIAGGECGKRLGGTPKSFVRHIWSEHLSSSRQEGRAFQRAS